MILFPVTPLAHLPVEAREVRDKVSWNTHSIIVRSHSSEILIECRPNKFSNHRAKQKNRSKKVSIRNEISEKKNAGVLKSCLIPIIVISVKPFLMILQSIEVPEAYFE